MAEVNDRENVRSESVERDRENGTLIVDDRRRRPLWFDGRWFDGQALTQEQNYFIARQSDVAQVLGIGVIDGLLVAPLADGRARAVRIEPGRGITPSGELVQLVEPAEVDLADAAGSEALNLSFGLAGEPKLPPANQSGLFVLALRRVEYSAGSVVSYPTSINGERAVEDASIVEATAVTLIPYADQGARSELTQRWKHVAKEIFVDASNKSQPMNVLPLAMLALNNGVIEWLDPYLVRRDVAPREQDPLGLGLVPASLRRAHLQQYRFQLDALGATRPSGFAAADEFLALPPAGPLPAMTVNVDDFTQSFFPADVDVELSIIADDEIYSMVEESFALPAIDLGSSELENAAVVVLVPVPRHEVRRLAASLQSVLAPLKPAAPGVVTKQRPIETLTRIGAAGVVSTASEPVDAGWREAFAAAGSLLWYTRRRNVQFKAELAGHVVPLLRDEREVEDAVEEVADSIDARDDLDAVSERSSIAARAEISSTLGRLRASPVLFRGAVRELRETPERINRAAALKIATRFAERGIGEGISSLEEDVPELRGEPAVSASLSASRRVPELDRLGRELPSAARRAFARNLLATSQSGDGAAEDRVAALIDERLRELKTPVVR